MASDRRTVNSSEAPEAIGPYSQAVIAGGLLYCSGQLPLDPKTSQIVGDNAAEQVQHCLDNLEAICKAAGCSLQRDAVKLTLYLVDLGEFAEVNAVYGEYFTSEPPARVTVEVSALPKGALIEVDAIVATDSSGDSLKVAELSEEESFVHEAQVQIERLVAGLR